MTAPTHLTFGALTYLFVLTTAGVPLTPGNFCVTLVASILPDIDTETSLAGKFLPRLTRWIERTFGHRTLTHSAIFVGALALVMLPVALINSGLYCSFLAGYLSHPVLDSMTVTGVHLFYPFSPAKCVFPLESTTPNRYRVQSGSRTDKALCLAFLALCIPSYLIANQGYERFIRTTQKTVEAAVKDYDEFSRTSRVYAQILAHDLLGKHGIEGIFEVVGALDDRTLVFRGRDGKLHTLGREYRSEYAAASVVCRRGESVRVDTRRIDLSSRMLGSLVSSIDARAETHLFGTLQTDDQIPPVGDTTVFNPIMVTAGSVRLAYATMRDIQALGLERLYIRSGWVTIRSIYRFRSDSIAASAPSNTTIERLVLECGRSDLLEVLCHEGDIVPKGALLASVRSAFLYDEKRVLNTQQQRALEEECKAKRGEHEERLRKAEEVLSADSTDLEQKKRMQATGFVPAPLVEALEVKHRRSSALLHTLRQDLFALEETYHARQARLRNERLLIDERERVEKAKGELRAPRRGEVALLKREQKGEKTIFIVLLRSTKNEGADD